MEEVPKGPRTVAAAAVLTGVAGLAILGAGTASAEEGDEQDYGASSTSGGLFGDTSAAGGGSLFSDPGSSSSVDGASATFGSGNDAPSLPGFGTGAASATPDLGPSGQDLDLPALDRPALDLPALDLPALDLPAPAGAGATPSLLEPLTEAGTSSEPASDLLALATPDTSLSGTAPAETSFGLGGESVGHTFPELGSDRIGTALGTGLGSVPDGSARTSSEPAPVGTTTQSVQTGGTGVQQGDPSAVGALSEDLDRLLGRNATPAGSTNPFAPEVDALTGSGVPPTGGLWSGIDTAPFGPSAPADGLGDDLFGLGDVATPGLLEGVNGTGSGTTAANGAPATANPWRITTFDDKNWPPRVQLKPRGIGYALGGILPTVGLTANQRRIANGTNLAQELAPSASTLFRSVPSDLLLGASPIEVFEGDLQNNVAKSFVSGAVITGLDEVARTAQNNLPEIQRRNAEFWANRANPPARIPVPRSAGTPQLSSGLARPTIFSIAPTVTALNLGADALTDRFGLDPKPTDRNNNRYYGELLTDSLATGAGVFLPIFGENYATGRAAALRAGTPVPKVGNIAAQTALAFGLPALQTFGAGILTEDPPDKTDPIYRGTRAAFQFIGDNATRAGDAAFGEGDTADGNGANATRAVGNAAATLATPVLDALGGSIPNVFRNLGHTYDYLTTDERRPQTEPIISQEAVAATEAARARAQHAWEAARDGDAHNPWDDLGKLGANAVYALGRGGIGLAHSVVAPVTDPFRSQESRFLGEPTQAQRGQDSFRRVQQAWQEAGEAVNGLLGRSPARR